MSAIERAIEKVGSQQKLADLIGVSQGLISQWINGAQIPHKHFPKIEAETGVTAHELLDDELVKLKKPVRRRHTNGVS
jgi:DNA-binding transcriptional regulator YdaS (Cro superfamily)